MPAKQYPSVSISFRLRGPIVDQLEQLAASKKTSPDLVAKELVMSVLLDETRLQLLEEVRAMRQELLGLRADVATTLETALLNLANLEEAEVREFISKRLRK